jgi:hypothetical protein
MNTPDDLVNMIGNAFARCLELGMAPPFVAACVGANGSVIALRYVNAANGVGLDLTPLASHAAGVGFTTPINIMVTDQDGEAMRFTIGPDGTVYQ